MLVTEVLEQFILCAGSSLLAAGFFLPVRPEFPECVRCANRGWLRGHRKGASCLCFMVKPSVASSQVLSRDTLESPPWALAECRRWTFLADPWVSESQAQEEPCYPTLPGKPPSAADVGSPGGGRRAAALCIWSTMLTRALQALLDRTLICFQVSVVSWDVHRTSAAAQSFKRRHQAPTRRARKAMEPSLGLQLLWPFLGHSRALRFCAFLCPSLIWRLRLPFPSGDAGRSSSAESPCKGVFSLRCQVLIKSL